MSFIANSRIKLSGCFFKLFKRTFSCRISVVGGGVGGLSTALHLAPLVSEKIISGPIYVFEGSNYCNRDIGVGIWSTALLPFLKSERNSHRNFIDSLQRAGQLVEDVGYRDSVGRWLTKSRMNTNMEDKDPCLMFVSESDLYHSLLENLQEEVNLGTVRLEYGNVVEGIDTSHDKDIGKGRLVFKQGGESGDSYHIIICAEGMNSCLRRKYAVDGIHHLVGDTDQCLENRNYSVFRGNAPLSGKNEAFQTWGENRSMRFAAVPFKNQCAWFATTNEIPIITHSDVEERKSLIAKAFSSWHHPIHHLISSTPADQIIVEPGLAHHYSVNPIVSLHSNLTFQKVLLSSAEVSLKYQQADQLKGYGPILMFVGDASMTVDPVLAQGFTMAMEDAHRLANTLRTSLSSSFNPQQLREEIKKQHQLHYDPRLLSLLRATELVHKLAQIDSNSFISGPLSKYIIRPSMRYTPHFIKERFFHQVVKYSLGIKNTFF